MIGEVVELLFGTPLTLVFNWMSAELLRFRLWEGEVVRGLLGSTSSMAGVTPRYHAVGDDGETSRVDLSSKDGEGRKPDSDMPWPTSVCPCIGRISPNSGFLAGTWVEGVVEVGERFVIDFEACVLALGADFFGRDVRVVMESVFIDS